MDEASQRPRSHSEAFRTLFAPLRAVGSRSPSPAPTSHGDNDAGVLDDEAALVLADPGPSVQGQGFSIYLASLVAYLAFLLWSLCPDRWLVAMGIEWYPNREWAVLVPAWSVMLVAFTYITYALVNVAVTPYRKILDPKVAASCTDDERDLPALMRQTLDMPPGDIPPLFEVPPELVRACRDG